MLDLGCGDGRYSGVLQQAGARVVGADLSQTALARARTAYPGVEFVQVQTPGVLPFPDHGFDAVACLNVLEHVADTQSFLSELRRVLAPSGVAAVVVPGNSWFKTVARGRRAFERDHDPLEPVLRFYTVRSLRKLLSGFGFEQVKVDRRGGLLRATALRG